jgi:hypothetical protein
MRLLRFTFKNEAIWMLILSIVPVLIGIILLVIFTATDLLSGDQAKTLAAAVLSPVVAVTGTALGFYFGAHHRSGVDRDRRSFFRNVRDLGHFPFAEEDMNERFRLVRVEAIDEQPGLDLAAFVERQAGGGFYGINGRDRRDKVALFLADGFAGLRKGLLWTGVVTNLANACALLGDAPQRQASMYSRIALIV